jgi:hypothetical protein
MTPEDIRKLVGGYATGTLTPEEEAALFAAALEDQELFDTLAREQSLRDLLRDPGARADLMAALDPPQRAGFWAWLARPLIAGFATAGVAVIGGLALWQSARIPAVKPSPPTLLAEAQPPTPRQAAGAPSEIDGTAEPHTASASRKKAAMDSPVAVPFLKRSFVPAPEPMAGAHQPEFRSVAPIASRGAASSSGPEAGVKKLPATDRIVVSNSFAPSAPGGVASGKLAIESNAPPPAPAAVAAPVPAKDAAKLVPVKGGALQNLDLSDRMAGVVAAKSVAAVALRCTILRESGEVPSSTPLNPSETVRLRIVAGADGVVSVQESGRVLATGLAQRGRPFDTEPLAFSGTGTRMLSLNFSPATEASRQKEEFSADVEKEKKAAPPVPVIVVPVALTYR